MTKKELLENRIFQNMPENTQIVFNTAVKAEDCSPVTDKDLSYRKEIVDWAKKEINPKTGKRDGGDYGEDPIYKHFLVINTNPY